MVKIIIIKLHFEHQTLREERKPFPPPPKKKPFENIKRKNTFLRT